MYDGLSVRWRETAPDRAVVAMAMQELSQLHDGAVDALQCEILIERIPNQGRAEYHAHVAVAGGLGRRERGRRAEGDGRAREPGHALLGAFRQLRGSLTQLSHAA